MARKPPSPTYWRLSCSAGTLGSGRWDLRCDDEAWERRVEASLHDGRELDGWPDPPPRFSYAGLAATPDVRTIYDGGVWIVSDRLRAFLEHAAPGSASFHPVRVEGPNRAALHGSYWAVNWLHAWDCHRDGGSEIDVGRIPADQRLGVVRDRGRYQDGVLARRELKLDLQNRGFVGLRFERASDGRQRSATVRRKNRSSGRMETVERRLLPEEPEFDVDAYFASGRGPNDPTDSPGETAFLAYVRFRSMDYGEGSTLDPRVVLRFLAEGGDPNAGHDQPNVSALLVCLSPKTPELLGALNDHGADWNVFNGLNGVTPLMAAAIERNLDAVRLLLGWGADAGQRDLSEMTALDHVSEAMELEQDEEERSLLRMIRDLLR